MKKKAIYGVAFLAVCGSILTWVQEASAILFVEQFDSTGAVNNLTAADELIAGGANLSGITSENSALVDYYDGLGGTGRSNAANRAFPGLNTNDFAIRVTTELIIPTTGNWTFLTNADDGVRLSLNGNAIITDNTTHSAEDRISTAQNLSSGLHSLELVFFESGGGASLELWAAEGDFTAFNSNFQLVGDIANGGLATASVPFNFSPTTGIVLSLGLLSWHQTWKKKESK